jgi:hypothetical protein
MLRSFADLPHEGVERALEQLAEQHGLSPDLQQLAGTLSVGLDVLSLIQFRGPALGEGDDLLHQFGQPRNSSSVKSPGVVAWSGPR